MRPIQTSALDLLMSYPDSTVAEMLGVKVSTLTRWMSAPGFRAALREREREQKSSAARIARQAAINAASTLCQRVADSTKADAKVLLEVLKASGAFDVEAVDPADALAEVLSRISSEDMSDE